jgi:hypothetical protein
MVAFLLAAQGGGGHLKAKRYKYAQLSRQHEAQQRPIFRHAINPFPHDAPYRYPLHAEGCWAKTLTR